MPEAAKNRQLREVVVIHPTIGQVQPAKLLVAAYARVSTEQEEQQSSYEIQIAYYTDKIMENKEWALAGIYSDEGISGTQAKKRTGFLSMIADCRKGKIDMILTKSISRFARNTVDALQYIRELKALGIAVVFEKEHINTMEIDSETFLTLQSCMAQAESESISGNIKWGRRKAFARGKVLYSYRCWYGYRRGDDGEPEIVPEEAEIVREIYTRYLAGMSTLQVAQELNGRGVPCGKGAKQWDGGKVQRILKNEKYCGDAISQKTFVKNCITKEVAQNHGELPMYYVRNAHDAIVSRETHARVQEETARRATKRKALEKPGTTEKGKYSGLYALSERLVCGECGTLYRRVTWAKRGKKKIVWRCLNRLVYGLKYCKTSPSIEESRLHDGILAAMRAYAAESGQLIEMLRDSFATVFASIADSDSLPATELRIREVDRMFADLLAATAKQGNPNANDEAFRRLSEERAVLAEQAERLRAEDKTHQARDARLAQVEAALQAAPPELRTYDDMLVRQIVDVVKVISETRILVVLKDGREAEQNI